jgi:hypothetical protein
MKQKISILSALLCLTFLFVSCLNPTQSESGKKSNTGNGGTGGYWSPPAGDSDSEDGDDDNDESVVPTANDFDVKFEGAGESGIPTISAAALDSSDESATLATVTPPKKGGPWTVELDDAALELFDIEYEKNLVTGENRLKALFAEGETEEETEDDAEGEAETAVDDWDFANIVLKKNKTLGWGRYSINLVIKGAGDITIYKTVTFDVVLTPAPFTKTPSLYPEITGAGKNKLTVNWTLVSGAESYNVYAGTTTERSQVPHNTDKISQTVQSYDITDLIEDDTEDGLPDGTKYYVWVEAVNDGGSSFSDPAVRTTSFTIPEFFYDYTDEATGEKMYSWDSFSGGDGGIDCYRILPPVEDENGYTPARMLYGKGGMTGVGAGWTAEIVYFDKFPYGKDSEDNYLRPNGTRTGKWGESLLDEQGKETPAGVFIVKYDNYYDNRIYQGVYYYGQGAIQTKDNGFGPNGTSPVGLTLCYFGNSYFLPSGPNPETFTLPEAIDRFTLANMSRLIAFIATPWYRCYGYEGLDWWDAAQGSE